LSIDSAITLWHWTNRPQLVLGQMQVQSDLTLPYRAARYFLLQRVRLSLWLGAAGGCLTALLTIGVVG
jgi:hypothetical protein